MEKITTSPVLKLLRSIARTARLMVGFPDYEAYVAHRHRMHPGEPIMSYEDFFRERQTTRYSGNTARCC